MKENLFVYPTDTVWGIGGSIFSKSCYEKIVAIKKRDANKPLSVLFPDIDSIFEFINIPESISKDWLKDFFKLESTLGVPKVWVKEEIPSWICQDSPFMAIRCIPSKTVKKLYSIVGTPITSTSFNRSGEEPIVDDKEAKKFFSEVASNETFIENLDELCSGRSSTIVLLKDSAPTIVRSGLFEKEVREHIKLLPTKLL